MTDGDAGWKASVDGVVSDFDVVTRHLRRRQGQAVRVAWSVVAATALAMGGLIVLNLTPAGVGPSAVPVSSSPPLSVIEPGSPNLPSSAGLGGLAFHPTFLPSPAPAAIPAAPVTAPPPAASRPKRQLTQVTAPVLAAVPVPPSAAVDPVTAAPPTGSPEPTPPPSSPSPSGGIVDALVGGVLHGTG